MKKFEFNYAQQTWDRFKAFHTSGWHNPFVEFANGALAVTNRADPCNRKLYDKYGIQLVTTTDSNVPPLYLGPNDEKPMPKAWVQQGGQQHLAIDWEQGVAVGVGYGGYGRPVRPEPWKLAVPDNLDSVFVYWAGPNRLPVSKIHITVSVADKNNNEKIQAKLRGVVPALKAIERMKSPPIPRYMSGGKLNIKKEWAEMTDEELVAELSKDDYTLKSVTSCGFKSLRIEQDVPYLYVKKED